MIASQYPKAHLFQPLQQSTAAYGQQKEPVHEAHLHQSLLQFCKETMSFILVGNFDVCQFISYCLLHVTETNFGFVLQ